ncbi:LexA family transcriptional regulator [Janthinobacterium sp. CG_S6]|uniref:LexA family transcriptional regulator n=1 Tax=Janthinobacterium sp. CG_S6 TaxID=3071707 RepID=UPI002DFD89C8|nr:phage repressor protein C with HTH and peptisase S24 domain [Janthinobacterium sp. CG_S6]
MNLLSERLAHIYSLRSDLEGERGQSGLVKASGASKSVVNQWLNDKIKSIDIRYALAIERELGFSHIWLMTGDGEPLMPAVESFRDAKQVVSADRGDPDYVDIPMVELRLSAGMTGFQSEPDRRGGGTLGIRRNWLERSGYDPTKLIAIHVKGESMEPSLYAGDLVVLNTADTKMIDGAVFAVNYEGEAVIKRLSRDAGEWWLTSDNPDQRKFHRKLCRGGECIIVGRVVRKESDRI